MSQQPARSRDTASPITRVAEIGAVTARGWFVLVAGVALVLAGHVPRLYRKLGFAPDSHRLSTTLDSTTDDSRVRRCIK